jgi:hypothetical protein
MLAAIGDFYHWPRADIEGLTASEARFWMAAAAALRERQKAESGG